MRFAVVDCPDVFLANATRAFAAGQPKIAMGFQFSCFCKTAEWFRAALRLVPSARFVGKMGARPATKRGAGAAPLPR